MVCEIHKRVLKQVNDKKNSYIEFIRDVALF